MILSNCYLPRTQRTAGQALGLLSASDVNWICITICWRSQVTDSCNKPRINKSAALLCEVKALTRGSWALFEGGVFKRKLCCLSASRIWIIPDYLLKYPNPGYASYTVANYNSSNSELIHRTLRPFAVLGLLTILPRRHWPY